MSKYSSNEKLIGSWLFLSLLPLLLALGCGAVSRSPRALQMFNKRTDAVVRRLLQHRLNGLLQKSHSSPIAEQLAMCVQR